MLGLKKLILALIVGSLTVNAEIEEHLKEALYGRNGQDVRLLFNPLNLLQLKPDTPKPEAELSSNHPYFPFPFLPDQKPPNYAYPQIPVFVATPAVEQPANQKPDTTRPAKQPRPSRKPAQRPPFYPPLPLNYPLYYPAQSNPPPYYIVHFLPVENRNVVDENKNKGSTRMGELYETSEALPEDQQEEYSNESETDDPRIQVNDISTSDEGEEDSDSIMVDTHGIKLPLGLQLVSSASSVPHPSNKRGKHQEALIYLRNSRNARKQNTQETE